MLPSRSPAPTAALLLSQPPPPQPPPLLREMLSDGLSDFRSSAIAPTPLEALRGGSPPNLCGGVKHGPWRFTLFSRCN